MTLAHRIRVFALAIVAATAFVAGTARAQSTPSATGPFAVVGYYSHYRLDAVGNDAVGMSGLGARVTWYPWRGTVSSDHAARFQSRVGLGLFGEYAPAQDRGFSMFHTGVQGDVSLLSTPLLGHVSPVASLGLGVLRTNLDNPSQAAATGFPLGMESTTAFSLAPSVGARVGFWRQLGLRADAGDVVTFRGDTRHNLQLTAGLSFPF
jgi:hypothetical protein